MSYGLFPCSKQASSSGQEMNFEKGFSCTSESPQSFEEKNVKHKYR